MFPGDGSTREFQVPFPYLDRDFVFVTVNGTETGFSWLNDSMVRLPTAPPRTAQVRVFRKTPVEPIHILRDNSPNRASAYNELTTQALHVAEELGGDGSIAGPGGVSSVAGKTGAVVLTTGDVQGLDTALADKLDAGEFDEFVEEKGAPNGLASLGADGKVPAAQLPAQPAGADPKAPKSYAKAEITNLTKLFENPSTEAGVRAGHVVDALLPFNTIDNRQTAGAAVHVVAEGSRINGPGPASVGQTVSLWKEGFGTGTAKGGEIDGIYVVVRQDSPRNGAGGGGPASNPDNVPDRGDACGLLIDVAAYQNVGFVGGIEGATTVLSNDNSGSAKQLGYQLGCIDTSRTNSIGLFLSAGKGSQTAGLRVLNYEVAGGYFEYFIECSTHAGNVFSVNRRGDIGIGARLDNGTTLNPAVHMRLQADYSLGWLNANKSVQLLNLDQNGNLSAFGNLNGTHLNAAGSVQAAGNIIAGGKVQATYLDLAPGGDPTNGASGQPGRLFVGPSGALRYYDSYGQARRVVMTD